MLAISIVQSIFNAVVVGLDCCRGNFRLRIVAVGKESVPTAIARYECCNYFLISAREFNKSEDGE